MWEWCVSAVSCGKPVAANNIVPVPMEVDLVYGQTYVYSCKEGFKPALDQEMVTACQANGTFSLAKGPICTGRQHMLFIVLSLNTYLESFHIFCKYII